jgi:hypothetical protein
LYQLLVLIKTKRTKIEIKDGLFLSFSSNAAHRPGLLIFQKEPGKINEFEGFSLCEVFGRL